MCSSSRILTVQYSAGRRRQIKAESPDYCNIIQDHNNNTQHTTAVGSRRLKFRNHEEGTYYIVLRYLYRDCKNFVKFVSSSSKNLECCIVSRCSLLVAGRCSVPGPGTHSGKFKIDQAQNKLSCVYKHFYFTIFRRSPESLKSSQTWEN